MTPLEFILRQHRAQIKGVIELRGVRKMRSVYESIRAELESSLASLVRTGRGETFTAYHSRLVLVQVREAIKQMGGAMVTQLTSTGSLASQLGVKHTISAVKGLEKQFTGHTPVLQLEQAAVTRGVYKSIQPSLLNRYKKSERYYGAPVVEAIKTELAKSIISGETIDGAVARVAGTDGIFSAQRWRADRIVRTEMAYSYGATQHRAMDEVKKDIPKLQKKLIETFDDRTGEDSKILHGQVRELDEPFVYDPPPGKKGYPPFQHSPGRPNDRSITLAWNPAWTDSSVTREGGTGPGDVRAEVPKNLVT